MKNLYQPETLAEVQVRLAGLTPTAERRWGTMTVAQMLAHCSLGMEWAVGDRRPPRMFVGRLVGLLVKRLALGDDTRMRRNSPTSPDLLVRDERDFEAEKNRLAGLLGRFAANGPAGCATHPHSFFGRLTPEEWAKLTYKHLDHHLRQFGA